MKLTAAQSKIINSLKSGKQLTAYRNFNRFVFNAGTESGYTVQARTVKPLIDSGVLAATAFEYGHVVTIAQQRRSSLDQLI
jgi:hypothetical protein